MAHVLRSRAPIRVDFAGGTTDLKAFRDREEGAVLNAAIARYAYCSLRRRKEGVRIDAVDLRQYVVAPDIRAAERETSLDLLTRVMRRFGVDQGVHITVRTDAPPGSGTGSSASVGIALLGLLDRVSWGGGRNGTLRSRYELAEIACGIETDLGIVGGKQDQYAAALGGFSFMRFSGDTVAVEHLELKPALVAELEKHLLLCYTGQSRLSGDTNLKMISAWERQEAQVATAMRRVRDVAWEMYRALLNEDLAAFAGLLNEETAARLQLSPDVCTPQMKELMRAGRQAGALSSKICGAGGGGCLLFCAKPDREARVRRALEGLGGIILDFNFDAGGLQVWEGRG